MIFLVLSFFFKHCEFHILFHAMLFTINIVVIGTIACIGYRIFWIFPIHTVKFFHQRNKAIHIRRILFRIYYCDIFITYCYLKIVSRKQLVISHVVFFYSHECCISICFRVTVSAFSTDRYVVPVP